MAARAIILPAGTSRTELINLPMCGSWLGLVRVGISTHTTNATIHEWLFIWPNMPGNKTGYRRTALGSANNYYNSTLIKDTNQLRWMAQNESMMRITYTASNPISVIYETNRSIRPAPYPELTVNKWNITSSTPWTGPGNNLTGGNPTEKAAGVSGQLNGLVYWKQTV